MPHLRQATANDQPAIQKLIDGVYHEYGDELYVAGADSDLLDIKANYIQRGGEFLVLIDASESVPQAILGTVAVVPYPENKVCKLHRLYLAPTLRGTGWGTQLMDWAIDWARTRDLTRMEFWSDVRFTRAHAFYARFGFQQGDRRSMTDGAAPYEEHFFWRDLG